MKNLTPIIMESEQEKVGEKLAWLHERQEERVHVDIVDGLFADLLTIAPADLQQFEIAPLEMDIHLLVDDPTEWVEECVALSPARLIAQIEKMGSQQAYLEAVRSYGATPGLALRLETPVESLEKEALANCPVVLLLAIAPGTSGNPMDERVLTKIVELKKIYQGAILIDGGINRATFDKVIAAGATEAGANSAYWKGEFDA